MPTVSAPPSGWSNATATASATVRLLPLDEARIHRLAAHYGVDRADAFIDTLKQTGHLFLAGRPGDLEWLAEYWKREGRIGARWDMLELNVLAKVQEANVAHSEADPLSPEKALWGAERLAGATILRRQPASGFRTRVRRCSRRDRRSIRPACFQTGVPARSPRCSVDPCSKKVSGA
ncbi:hypothetical protein [Azospirillum oryzae]|uniref:hypothetical protein n=1 Tax=Azospirillum oryzae TaxID=286727 RepID=UPI001ABF7E4A|nr:hypothetical protein [Azospirillum oryzae]